MHDEGMTPPEGMTPELTPEPNLSARCADVPKWIAVCSIIFGILGLLCWGAQGAASMFTDVGQAEEAMGSGHLAMSIAGALVNFALAILLIVAGSKAMSMGSGCLLRMWACLKLLAVALGLMVTAIYFDEIMSAVTGEMSQAIEEQSKAAAAQGADAPQLDEDTIASLGKGFGIGAIAVQALIQVVWPIIVLSCVKRRCD
jgi:hypothetical protein